MDTEGKEMFSIGLAANRSSKLIMNKNGCLDYYFGDSNDDGKKKNIKTKFWTKNVNFVYIESYESCVNDTDNNYRNLNFEPYYRNFLIKIDN